MNLYNSVEIKFEPTTSTKTKASVNNCWRCLTMFDFNINQIPDIYN